MAAGPVGCAREGLQQPGVPDQLEPVGEPVRPVQLSIHRVDALAEIVGRKVQACADGLGRDAGVQLPVVVVGVPDKGRARQARIDAPSALQAPGVAGVADQLRLLRGAAVELDVGAERPRVPATVMVVRHVELNCWFAIGQRNAAHPIVGHQ